MVALPITRPRTNGPLIRALVRISPGLPATSRTDASGSSVGSRDRMFTAPPTTLRP